MPEDLLMLRGLVTAAVIMAAATAVHAACDGQDILAGLPLDERAKLEARADAAPFARGNLWRAERDGSVIHVVGTFHIGDPRMGPMMDRLAPLIAGADLVMVEITPEEEQRLASAMTADPGMAYIVEGPTLRDLLTQDEWQSYAAEMAARGIPAFVASRFQPWLAFSTLSIPACLMTMEAMPLRGLDDRIITYARDLGIAVEGLETHEVLQFLFDALTGDESLDILRATLIQAELSEDMFATLANAYFAGEHRLIWEFSRGWMPESARHIFPRDRAADIYDRLEATLLIRRNRAWLEAMLPRAKGRTVLMAVGAAHLSGHDGVLDLLARAGFSLERVEM